VAWFTGRTSVDIGIDANLELMDKFCYLGDMLSVDGDADAAVEIRIRIGWNKFRQFIPLLITKDVGLSLILRGRLYSSCMRSSMLCGSSMRMVRWMCGIQLQDRVPSKGLRERLGLDDIISVLQIVEKDCQAHKLNREDAIDCNRWRNHLDKIQSALKWLCVCVCVCVCG